MENGQIVPNCPDCGRPGRVKVSEKKQQYYFSCQSGCETRKGNQTFPKFIGWGRKIIKERNEEQNSRRMLLQSHAGIPETTISSSNKRRFSSTFESDQTSDQNQKDIPSIEELKEMRKTLKTVKIFLSSIVPLCKKIKISPDFFSKKEEIEPDFDFDFEDDVTSNKNA